MENAEIYQRLNGIFREVFDDDGIEVQPDLTADDVDEWDSLGHIRLLLTVEKAFGVKFSASEIGNLNKMGQLVELIQQKVTG